MPTFHSMLGANFDGTATIFRVWAPGHQRVSVRIGEREVDLRHERDGNFSLRVDWAKPGMRYLFVLDGQAVPDPYARFLPDGVHAAAEIVDLRYPFAAPSRPIDLLRPQSIYELHVGTFSEIGTYQGVIDTLDALVDLGVTIIELMPVAAFPGQRGWGYDGVALYAPFAPYGRPEDLCRLVDAAHARGLSIILDVVLNHFGPDGNYLWAYTDRYFDTKVQTPWGPAPAFREPHMRALTLGVCEQWLDVYRFDGLRLDATHEIADETLLADIARLAHARGALVICEDDRNEPALIMELGVDGVWADDLHHAIHSALTGEHEGYYARFHRPTKAESAALIAQIINQGWLRGKPKGDIPHARLITCLQNHDQIGNRALGDRLSTQISRAQYKAASLVSLLLPTTPLIFMGQEWGATTPFLYFTDHNAELGRAVVDGRRKEFAQFKGFSERIPSPQERKTMQACVLRWEDNDIRQVYKEALRLRREMTTQHVQADARGAVISIQRGDYAIVWDLEAERAEVKKGLSLSSRPG